MRILHLIPSLAGGGAEKQLTLLARQHTQRGHELHVAVLQDGSHTRAVESFATVHRLSTRSNHNPALVLQMAALIRRLQPDVLQTWLQQMDVLGGVAAQLTRVPWVMTERCCAEAYPPTVKHWLRLTLGRRSDAIVSNSAGGDRLWAQVAPGRQLRVIIPNGLANGITANGSAARAANETPLILYAGRFAEQKNVHGVIDALQIVLQRTTAGALLCGEGPDRAAVERRIAEARLQERIRVDGYRADLSALMQKSAVFVAISWFEGHPNTVLEAMACGCPVVLSRIPAHSEFADESCAWLVDPADRSEIAQAIEAIIRDPALAVERVRNAHARVSKYSEGQAALAYEELYERVLLARSRHGKGSA